MRSLQMNSLLGRIGLLNVWLMNTKETSNQYMIIIVFSGVIHQHELETFQVLHEAVTTRKLDCGTISNGKPFYWDIFVSDHTLLD